jgi:hypothetical protein
MEKESIYEISEAASVCNLNSDIIMAFIKYEWINPVDPKKLLLDEEDISRIQLISELTTNLGANKESVPIILHLIDQLHYLHLVGR